MPPRSLRKRPVTLDEAHESGEEDAAPKLSVEDTRLLQRQRQRQTGVDAAALLQGRRDDEDRELALASAAASAAPEEGGLHAAFKRERQQDEGADNPHMKQYVEAQLAARLGRPAPGSEQPAAPRGIDDELFATSQYQRKDDLELGPSWITGITEVPLSMDQRLKNIEDTETAKKKMLTRSGMVSIHDADDDDDEEEGAGSRQALRRGQYPVFFGKQDPAMLKRVEEAQIAKKQKKAYYADIRAKKRQEDRPSW
ncbi:hypothetical protein ACKKBG_A29325 [Auxenochlorella protothecoides x Auxenochlorella symbiontica]